MKLPWQKSDDNSVSDADSTAADNAAPEGTGTEAEAERLPRGYTAPKGRPTPRRREVEIERGVIRDPGTGSSSPQGVRARRKELKASMTKEEWQQHKKKEREENRKRQREAQRRMDSGEEKYLLPRDQGPERRFIRDWADSRRFINNAVMPVALFLLLVMLIGSWAPRFANLVSLGAMILIVVFVIEGVMLGRRAAAAARRRFPDTNLGGFSMGFYAYSRATQPRRWRTPKPQVELGANVGG